MPDLSHIALAAASLFFAASVVTTLWVSTRRTKADIRREARRQARTARFLAAEAIPSPANDLTPEARHVAHSVAG